MSQKEIDRLLILDGVIKRKITQGRASEVLGLSERQVRRLVKRIKQSGAAGIAHGNRGKHSRRKLTDERAAQIMEVVRSRYRDFGPTLAAEKLREREGLEISREKLRQLMREAGLWKRARRRRRVHTWRERKAHVGQMVQLDGPHHDWLEGRGPRMAPMGFCDDASSRFYGRFHKYEGVYPAMDSLERYIRRYGRPMSLYVDKHSTYKTNRQASFDELLRGESASTQLQRACGELGIEVIHAGSPQARGRVERSFGTHQDRLVKEMRLEGISTMEQANDFLDHYYLPRHNEMFTQAPLKSEDLHRRLPPGMKFCDIFCIKEKRIISNGYTIQWKNRQLLIDRPTAAMQRRPVEVREHFDGSIEIVFNGRKLKHREITGQRKPDQPKPSTNHQKGKSIPSPDHPWRKWNPGYLNDRFLQKNG